MQQPRTRIEERNQAAPRMREVLEGELRAMVNEKAALMRQWMDEGRIARCNPVHLVFPIWALTQHYADFDVQVRAVLGPGHDPFAEAEDFVLTLHRRLLTPDG